METSDRFPNHKYAFFIQSTKNGYFSSKEAPTWLKSIFSLQYRYWEGLLSRGGTASRGCVSLCCDAEKCGTLEENVPGKSHAEKTVLQGNIGRTRKDWATNGCC